MRLHRITGFLDERVEITGFLDERVEFEGTSQRVGMRLIGACS